MSDHSHLRPPLTGRCYCGETTLSARALPVTVAYCHCTDCRRVSGAPVAAFVAFRNTGDLFTPSLGAPFGKTDAVKRWSCPTCAPSLAATYAYLPDQIYVPLGLFDAADQIAPILHCHTASQLPWLHISDDLPKHAKSARTSLLPELHKP